MVDSRSLRQARGTVCPPCRDAAAIGGIRTYAVRAGRMSRSGARRLNLRLAEYGVPLGSLPPNWGAIFGDGVPLHAEIGSGSGEAVLHYARTLSDTGQVAFEVYPPGMAALLRTIEREKIGNVRAVMADAAGCLRDFFAEGSLAGMRVFYPDPWPKTRHRKRRLVNAGFLRLVHRLLAPGAEFWFATDWPDYFEQVLAAAGPGWTVVAAGISDRHRAGRPVTRFERRAKRENRPSFDLRLSRD